MVHKRVAVLGAGSWGTALATVLADNGCNVMVWARRKELAEEIDQHHTNQKYLPNQILPASIHATHSLRDAVIDRDIILFVVPSQVVRTVAKEVCPYVKENAMILHASKGFELETYKRISEVLIEECVDWKERLAVISGPSHAEEVVRRSPTTVVVASESNQVAEEAQSVLMNSYFRVYTNPDLIGVEVGGALKNIIGLASGVAAGLDYGDNALAALMTRGLAEIARLGIQLGADPLTFVGLAGIGDLIATCTSQHSRNWRAGYLLGRGEELQQILTEMGMVVEGVKTTQAAYSLARKYQVEMPIADQLYSILFQKKHPKQAVSELMNRGRTNELDEIRGFRKS
ncbi:glycerol-3-phosphate dehydrogenase (NAD(P)+) [Seinonella peptonophila]|uniref:Glycerol-3-phosphate dehydrogenase [NAD(P)+] n=1 Tax=Seinonella peptonophila TaxID=112248 RepID=A0A1M4TGU2_9BACL|nr:NAD(P)H-dependent glycerol-3-phosphate dehydrogenase [Seinonella peptonophila]SHE43690.1 glycerol-3-phosphate dehydrogenase (NAD(P)+) [Seinonella peptonophila]